MLGRLFGGLVLASALAFGAVPALAQTYPFKTVRLIVGFAPGGGTDIVARLLAQKLSETLGQTFVVENRAGATGTIGAKAVATSTPDGYTLLMGHVNSQAIAPALMERPPYDPLRDFVPVTYIGYTPNVLVINAAQPEKTVGDLVTRAKAQSKGIFFASPGIGSTNHLAGEMLRMESGGNFVHVPYKGSGPATVDLLGGQIDMNFDALSSAMPYIKEGRLRALAVTGPKRDPDLADILTMGELGFKTYDITNWYGIVAPAGTPEPIVATLSTVLQRILQMPDVSRRLSELAVRPGDMNSEQFGAFIGAEYAKYREFAKRTGIRVE